MDDPPQIEHARSNRSTCKRCGDKIPKGELRIGFYGERNGYKSVRWFHVHCAGIVDPNVLRGLCSLTQDEQDIVKRYIVKRKTISLVNANTTTATANLTSSKGSPCIVDLTLDNSSDDDDLIVTKNTTTTTSRSKACYCNDTPCWCCPDEKLTQKVFKEDKPVSTGLARIQFATAKSPSACMHCSEKIRHGDPRVGYCQPSSFYEVRFLSSSSLIQITHTHTHHRAFTPDGFVSIVV
jgi:hypothetical protein